MSIMDEIESIAAAEVEAGVVADAAEWANKIVTMLAAQPESRFVFLMCSPKDDGGVIVSQLSNAYPPVQAWMLGLAQQAVIQRGMDDFDEGSND
jgi:hypothetical protein